MEAATQGRNQQEEARLADNQQCQDAAEPRDDFQRRHQEHSWKKGSTRETRQDPDHDGGVLGDHGGRLLQNTRPSRGNAEPLERARTGNEPAKYRC